MKVKDYLKASMSPEIRVMGLKGKTKIIERPTLEELTAVCEKMENGKVEFENKARFVADQNMTVDKVELWYNNKLVALRSMPEAKLKTNDTLDINWSMYIERGKMSFQVGN